MTPPVVAQSLTKPGQGGVKKTSAYEFVDYGVRSEENAKGHGSWKATVRKFRAPLEPRSRPLEQEAQRCRNKNITSCCEKVYGEGEWLGLTVLSDGDDWGVEEIHLKRYKLCKSIKLKSEGYQHQKME